MRKQSKEKQQGVEDKLASVRQQETVAALGMYALEQQDLKAIIHRAIQQLCMTLEIEYVLLLTWDEKRDMLKVIAHNGFSEKKGEVTEIEANQKWDAGYALRADKPLVVTDYKKEERCDLSPLVDEHDILSGVNIKVTESEEICGILCVYSKDCREYSESELNFIQTVTNLIGMASEKLKAKQDLEEKNRQLREEIKRSKEFQKQIIHNSIIERWDLGGYLHDDLAQILASVKISVGNIEANLKSREIDISSQIEEVTEHIDESISVVRDLTHQIIPVDIEAEGITHAFRLLMRQMEKTHEIKCTLETGRATKKITDREMATNLYHVIQEAIKNAAIHGKAKNVKVMIDEKDENLRLQVTDDGVGLSSTQNNGAKHSSGVNIMRHRIELFGGSFSIKEISDNGKTGTRITCMLPLGLL